MRDHRRQVEQERRAACRPRSATVIAPPSASTWRFTASRPTPRPETSLTSSLVEMPGSKISSRMRSAGRSSATISTSRPRSIARRRTFSTSIPRPSSSIRSCSRPSTRAAREPQGADRILAGGGALGLALEPVVERVAHQVQERVVQVVEHAAVDLDLFAGAARPARACRARAPGRTPRAAAARAAGARAWCGCRARGGAARARCGRAGRARRRRRRAARSTASRGAASRAARGPASGRLPRPGSDRSPPCERGPCGTAAVLRSQDFFFERRGWRGDRRPAGSFGALSRAIRSSRGAGASPLSSTHATISSSAAIASASERETRGVDLRGPRAAAPSSPRAGARARRPRRSRATPPCP